MGRGQCRSPQDAGPTSPPPNQPLSSGAAGGPQGTSEMPSLAVGAGGASNGASRAAQRLGLRAATAGARVPPPVREVRPHKTCGTAKK